MSQQPRERRVDSGAASPQQASRSARRPRGRFLPAASVAAGVAAALTIATPEIARAGLVFEIANDIDGRAVRSVQAGEDQLVFQLANSAHTIHLPEGTRDLVVRWAAANTGGPMVFSIDGSLVSSVGDMYAPPSVPEALLGRLFAYDSYAHQVACGALPLQSRHGHPLVRSTGGMDKLPEAQYSFLLSSSNRTKEATWYRRLAARLVSPPDCVGEMTFQVTRGDAERPLRVKVNSWIHQMTTQWYRGVDVPTEWDRWTARLPYRYLKQSIEEHWDDYREAFAPLDELTSMVEAIALLRAVRTQAPLVFADLKSSIQLDPDPAQPARAINGPRLMPPQLRRDPWEALSRRWVGSEVDTAAEANLALSLLVGGRSGSDQRQGASASDLAWWNGIEDVAKRDTGIQAKLKLAQFILADQRAFLGGARDVKALFSVLHQDFPNAFRLRAQALTWLELLLRVNAKQADADDDRERLSALGSAWEELDAESTLLLNDFLSRAERECDARVPSKDVSLWESLSQDVYSVGLLRRASRHKSMEGAVLSAVACIHRNRALAPQSGRELAFRHAHYRFLGYLLNRATDPSVKRKITLYRDELARLIGLNASEAT